MTINVPDFYYGSPVLDNNLALFAATASESFPDIPAVSSVS